MKTIIILSVLIISGCASIARDQTMTHFNNNYYIVGGYNCNKWMSINANSIYCYTYDKKYTGTRFALTPDQIKTRLAFEANRAEIVRAKKASSRARRNNNNNNNNNYDRYDRILNKRMPGCKWLPVGTRGCN